MRARFGVVGLIFLFSLTTGSAAVYEVGPGKQLASLFNVPWKSLQPGDVVNIYPKPGGYKEKIQISASGTAAQHIVVRGIPDAVTGALPVLEANGAVEDPSIDWRSPVLSNFGMITEQHPQIEGIVHQDQVLAIRVHETGLLKADSRRYEANGVIWFTLEGAQIKRIEEFFHTVFGG